MTDIDPESTCRICLEDGAIYPLFESNNEFEGIHAKLAACIREKIENIEGYPRNICLKCKNTSDTICSFISKFEETCKILERKIVKVKTEKQDSLDISDNDFDNNDYHVKTEIQDSFDINKNDFDNNDFQVKTEIQDSLDISDYDFSSSGNHQNKDNVPVKTKPEKQNTTELQESLKHLTEKKIIVNSEPEEDSEVVEVKKSRRESIYDNDLSAATPIRTSYNHTMVNQPEKPRYLTVLPLPLKNNVLTETQNAAASTSVTPVAEPLIYVPKLPEKSRKLYEKEYNDFVAWKIEKKTTSFSENVILAYLKDLSDKFKPSSMWAKYSKLKSTLSIYNNIDITKYSKVIAFLKRRSEGHKEKKPLTFTSGQIKMFLEDSPDILYLFEKVALIFGIMGACRRQELYNIQFDEVSNIDDSTIMVKVSKTKTKIDRSFVVTGNCYAVCKKYMELRPTPCRNPAFFLSYRSGKCFDQRTGINKFGALEKTIASFLNLPNPALYTGHCFRRISATLLIDSGGDLTALKRHGGRKSSTVAESYFDDSESQTNKGILRIIYAQN